MEHISKPIETVLGRQPATSSDNSESPSPQGQPSASSAVETGNLATRWQRLRIGLEAITPAVQEMATETEMWCRRVRENSKTVGRLLVLAGPFGCGKTVMLRGAYGYVRDIYMRIDDPKWRKSLSITAVAWPKFLADYIENRNEERMEDVTSSDVIFLDDVGAESDRFRSGEPKQILGDLLGRLDSKFVFVTTNIEPAAWARRWDGRVDDRLNRNQSVVVDGYDPVLRAESYAKWQLSK